MTLFQALLPLRVTTAQPIADMLGECRDEWRGSEALGKLQQLRTRLANVSYPSSNSSRAYPQAVESLPLLKEYYQLVWDAECKAGFPSLDTPSSKLYLEWESALDGTLVGESSLTWERASLLWNWAVIETYMGCTAVEGRGGEGAVISSENNNTNSREAWSQAAQHIQTAACLVNQLQITTQQRLPSMDFTPSFLELWKCMLVAQAQRCAYQSLACAPRPKYMLLAKVAAAAVPLYQDCAQFAVNNNHPELQELVPELLSHWTDSARAWGMWWSSQAELDQANLQRDKKEYGIELARLELAESFATLGCDFLATTTTSTPITEALQSLQRDMEARLTEVQLRRQEGMMVNQQQQEHPKPIPHRQELAEIRGQRLVNLDQTIEKMLLGDAKGKGPASESSASLFDAPPPSKPAAVATRKAPPAKAKAAPTSQTVSSSRNHRKTVNGYVHTHQQASAPPSRQFHSLSSSSASSSSSSTGLPVADIAHGKLHHPLAQQFQHDLDRTVKQLTEHCHDRSDAARSDLAKVHLPHSVTTYRQEQLGGGIPDDLWAKVSRLQQDRTIATLKQDLWGLRDVAEQAKASYDTIRRLLDVDLESDAQFRQRHANFQGHDTQEVQSSVRQSLATFDRLLTTAQEGDTVLLKRLESLDTNPRYKLLQFQKAQLDRLLPPAQNNNNNNSSSPLIDTSVLSQLLVELSTLLHDRDDLLDALQAKKKQMFQENDISSLLQRADPSTYDSILGKIRAPIDALYNDIQRNLDRQNGLMDSILTENQVFIQARNQASSEGQLAAADGAYSCIAMIDDALEEIDQLTRHLQDGREFYNVVIPKLTKLQLQVEDVSARLAAERLEFEDRAHTSQQEQADAAMAHRMSTTTTTTRIQQQPGATTANPDRVIPTTVRPGFQQISPDGIPETQVDDEKVATLVAMEFDPAKVVAALIKYDNNVDQALNELLSG